MKTQNQNEKPEITANDVESFEFFKEIGLDEDTAFQMVMAKKPEVKKINGFKLFSAELA